MATIGIKKSTYDKASKSSKFLLEASMSRVGLGQPVTYNDGKTDWYVWDDHRVTVQDAENIAALAKNLSAMPKVTINRKYATTETVKVEVPVRVQIKVPVMSEPEGDEKPKPTGETALVWVDDPGGKTKLVDEERSLGDRFSLAAEAQSAPSWFKSTEKVPESWTPTKEKEIDVYPRQR